MRLLICGVTGQDGALLAERALAGSAEVWGSSRQGAGGDLGRLRGLGIADDVHLVALGLQDAESTFAELDRIRPDAIVNLAGQSSVAASFDKPVETIRSSVIAGTILLEWVRLRSPGTRLIHAASGDCFGDTGNVPANEATGMNPRSPYAVGKCGLVELARIYRASYGLQVSAALLFSHESLLRPPDFVTRKVVAGVLAASRGAGGRLQLGNLSVVRDWGWAAEYMDAMWRMVQHDSEDFVIATGESISLETFVAHAFAEAGLDWREHVVSSASLRRPSDIQQSRADPRRAAEALGWRAATRGTAVARRLVRESAEVQ